jgi:mono/diheme cytochrome c family protein
MKKISLLKRAGVTKTSVTVAIAVASVALLIGLALYFDRPPPAATAPDLRNPQRIAAGKAIYDRHCAACHGGNLEGHVDWRTRLPNGRMLPPPHDDSGHTWHHPSEVLFALTKNGLKPPYAPADYPSDMPAFAGTLSDDDIWNVLAFIRSRWSEPIRTRHAELERQYAEQQQGR